jgi:hypothetical protein
MKKVLIPKEALEKFVEIAQDNLIKHGQKGHLKKKN